MYKNIDYFVERDNMKETYGCDTMCTAKFLSSTIYLQSGQTHSCYHPLPHQVELEEIKDNPSAIHNSQHKIKRRKEMMLGMRPQECNYCWRVEEMGPEHLSDRIIKSKNELLLSPNAHEHIKKNGWDHNYQPTYIEISFGNECNMRCAYCHPKASSAWMKEMDLEGPLEFANHLQVLEEKIYPEDDNPYVDAFWKWWPQLRKHLKVIRITGGEPLLQQNAWKFLDKLDQTGECKDMIVQINTNLNIKTKLIKRMCDKVNKLLDENKIKKFAIFSSIESWGDRATYTRNGLDLELFEANLRTIMKEMGHQHVDKFSGIQIMNTFNIMSVTSYTQFLEKMIDWRQKLQKGKNYPKVSFDIPHCTEPNHWTLVGLPDSYDNYFDLISEFFEIHKWKANWQKFPKNQHDDQYFNFFSEEEVRSWDRVKSYWRSIMENRAKVNTEHYLEPYQIDDARRNWYLFIRATDKRRNTDFLKTFPEMKDYYDLCGTLFEIENMPYNQSVKNEMLAPGHVDFHWDDDFVWQHPRLAQSLINYRKIKSFPTRMFNDDNLIGQFGDLDEG